MVNLPAKIDILDQNISTGVWKEYYGRIRDFIGQMIGGSGVSQLTVVNNTIFPVAGLNELSLDGGATKGILNTIDINNLPVGSCIILSVVTDGVQITLKNNFGGQGSMILFNNQDLVLTSGFSIFLLRSGSRWMQVNFAGYIFSQDGLVNNAYITKATTTQEGIVRMSTVQESDAGTDNKTAMSPARVQDKIDAALKVVKPQSLYQALKQVDSSGAVLLEDDISIYQATITRATNFTFNTNTITNPYSVLTFELHIKMAEPFPLTFPATLIWAYREAPDMSLGGQYLLVFRSFDGGASWIGSLEVKW